MGVSLLIDAYTSFIGNLFDSFIPLHGRTRGRAVGGSSAVKRGLALASRERYGEQEAALEEGWRGGGRLGTGRGAREAQGPGDMKENARNGLLESTRDGSLDGSHARSSGKSAHPHSKSGAHTSDGLMYVSPGKHDPPSGRKGKLSLAGRGGLRASQSSRVVSPERRALGGSLSGDFGVEGVQTPGRGNHSPHPVGEKARGGSNKSHHDVDEKAPPGSSEGSGASRVMNDCSLATETQNVWEEELETEEGNMM